jgi:RNA polymerase sigma-70 factor, ECF subfamily
MRTVHAAELPWEAAFGLGDAQPRRQTERGRGLALDSSPARTPLRDRALLDRFRRGDPRALETVYWAYASHVEDAIRRVLRASGVAHARIAVLLPDLAQEAFIKAFAEPGRTGFDGVRDYGPYVAVIARNVTIDCLRRGDRELPVALEDLDLMASDREADGGLDPDVAKVLADYVSSLSAEQRALYQSRFDEGLSQEAAAGALGISRQELRTRERKLRQGLEAALRARGIDLDGASVEPAIVATTEGRTG